jgi:hypothetical protein
LQFVKEMSVTQPDAYTSTRQICEGCQTRPIALWRDSLTRW